MFGVEFLKSCCIVFWWKSVLQSATNALVGFSHLQSPSMVILVSLSFPIFDDEVSQLARCASQLCCWKSQKNTMFLSSVETIIAENDWKPKLLSKKKNAFALVRFSVCSVYPPCGFSRHDIRWRSALVEQVCLRCHSEICASCSKTLKWVSRYIKTRWFSSRVIAKSHSGISIYENRAGTDDAPVAISEACIELTLHPVSDMNKKTPLKYLKQNTQCVVVHNLVNWTPVLINCDVALEPTTWWALTRIC